MLEMSQLKNEVVLATAHKLFLKQDLNELEQETANCIDAWAKKIGETGYDRDHELAAFIQKEVAPIAYELPNEILDRLFDRDSIGEFDDYMVEQDPKNTLVVYDAAKGGNVDKSYIDYTEIAPHWYNKQVETSISYTDLRKNGAKTVAKLVVYMEEALTNKMFQEIFGVVNSAITSDLTSQYFTSTGVTEAALDKLALYLIDRNPNGSFTVSLSKYAQSIAKLSGYSSYLSEAAKNELHQYGLLKEYQGVEIGAISSAIKQNDVTVIPDSVILGFAGKIGNLTTRGEVRTYEDMDNNKEQVNIKMTGFEFGYCITHPENMCKIAIA